MSHFLEFVRSLFQSPEGVELRYQRYFVATNSIYVLAGLIHLAFIFFFLAVGAKEMALFNIGSVVWFGFTIWINRKKYLFTSLYLCFLEVFLHALAATYFFGWGAGYQYYMMLFATGIFLLPPGKTFLKFGSIVIGCFLFASTYYYSISNPPIYVWDPSFLALINVSNIIFSTLFHAGFAYYFTLSANIAEESLERENNAQKAFFQNISHELRTPLTLISGPSESAVQRGEGLPESEVRLIVNQSRRLTRLVNQLLDLQKITSGKMELKKLKLPLGEFLNQIAENFTSYAKRKKIQFDLILPTNSIYVEADPEQLDKCIFNYLSNAIKFTESGGKIILELSLNDSEAVVSVKDTGIGMNSHQMQRLFSRFGISEASLTKEQEGTGLGLSLVKELVDLHGGKVGVESELGSGSHFYFSLPIIRDFEHGSSDQWLSYNTVQHEYISEDPFEWVAGGVMDLGVRSQKILVVEDNPDLRSYIGSVLTRNGYHVFVAPDGQAGIESVFKESPDLIISDLMMPKKSGLDLIREVRKKDHLKSLPIILLTAKADDSTRQEVHKEGADFYLSKPFIESELLNVIKNAIRLKEKESYFREELTRGIRIQKKLFPPIQYDSKFLTIHCEFYPSDGIAGDYYLVKDIGNGKTLVFLADVSGHGFAAGMISAMLYFILKQTDILIDDPLLCLKRINSYLYGNTAGLFVTAIAVVIDSNSNKFFWSKAGHEDIYFGKKDKQLLPLSGKGKPLGLFPDWDGNVEEVSFSPGDKLFLCSDGLFDSQNTKSESFRDSGFVSWSSISKNWSEKNSIKGLIESAKNFSGKQAFEDDVTVLEIQFENLATRP